MNDFLSPNSSNDFTFIDFDNVKKRHHAGAYLSVNTTGAGISPEVSDVIKAKGLTLVRLRVDNITNDIHVVFNRERGLNISFPKRGHQLRICSREFSATICRLTGANADTMVKIYLSEDLANSNDYATFKINK